MTAVYAFHPSEGDRPTTADLLDHLLADAETTRREPDRIIAALDEGVCPKCEGPTEPHHAGVACMRCDWWWAL